MRVQPARDPESARDSVPATDSLKKSPHPSKRGLGDQLIRNRRRDSCDGKARMQTATLRRVRAAGGARRRARAPRLATSSEWSRCRFSPGGRQVRHLRHGDSSRKWRRSGQGRVARCWLCARAMGHAAWRCISSRACCRLCPSATGFAPSLGDFERCPRCDGAMRWVHAATAAKDIARLLAEHGLGPRAPPPPNPSPSGQLRLAFQYLS